MPTRINLKESVRVNRINRSNELILINSLSGKMNNTKWKELFELIESITCEFRIKLLTDTDKSIQNNWNKNILELEESHFLIDNYEDYGFIQYKEIERVDITCKNGLESLWNKIQPITISVLQNGDLLSIFGY